MEISDQKLKEISRRVMISRMRLLVNNGFYGLLLMHMKISIGTEYETAWTDGKDRIWFHPKFIDAISDQELDYVLMHQLLHVVLQHTFRRKDYDESIFDQAADIVVNSNILQSNNGNLHTISLNAYGGEQPHLSPNGKEGAEYFVEELYRILFVTNASAGNNNDSDNNDLENDNTESDANNSSKTKKENTNGDNTNGNNTKGNNTNGDNTKGNNTKSHNIKRNISGWDQHISHVEADEDELLETKEKWDTYMRQACEAISIRDPLKQRGLVPMFAERYMLKLKRAQTDWRQLLTEFVQDEINDYSFTPPDRRMDDCPFFLPDFNERDEKPGKILFAVDCSGSMSDEELTACYSELKGAIEQFNGKLEGWLGFFDVIFTKPVPFSDVDTLLSIKPIGGGGTSFDAIFQYLRTLSEDDLPVSIVILTDGYAPFPSETCALGIPVLWIINNEEVQVPWGKVARIKVDDLLG